MNYRWLSFVALAALVVVFAGCSRPETPQQVATEFWQALAEGNADDASELSTLATPTDTGAFESFGGDWLNTLPNFGRVVIDADQATIKTVLATDQSAGDAAASARREITTYLVKINEQWLVDYQRTREAVSSRSPFSGLQSDISKLRQQFDDAVGRSSEQASEQLDQLTEKFEAYSEETGKKAEQAMEALGESLEGLRQQIKESIDEAQKDREENAEPSQGSLEQAAI